MAPDSLKRSAGAVNGLLPNGETTTPPPKRKRANEALEYPIAKKIKASASPIPPPERATSQPSINETPSKVQSALVFGNGDNGELGLGPNRTESLRPRTNPFLDPATESAFQVVQLACGGMHTVALAIDNKIITWGVNDNYALGRDTNWDAKLRDIDDAESGDEEAELNPLESTPGETSPRHFPAGTRFVQVASGDSCSFALTDAARIRMGYISRRLYPSSWSSPPSAYSTHLGLQRR